MSIYVLRYGNLVKIGFSGNLASRVRSIIASIPGDVTFVGHMPGDAALEQHLHHRFEADRFSGEWFALSDRVQAFCDLLLDPVLPEAPDRRKHGLRKARDYPEYAVALRSFALIRWPETDHKKRVAALAETAGWSASRTKKLYYGETEDMTEAEADRLRAMASEIDARKIALRA